MAYRNQIINNPVTGQQIQFLQTAADTGGKLLEMEAIFRAHSTEPPPHYHPYQDEYFMVLSGQIIVRMVNGLKLLRKGDSLHIPKNTVHSMWNHTDQSAVVNWKMRPALDMEYFLEAATAMTQKRKGNNKVGPGLLEKALLAKRFQHVFRLARPSFGMQKVMFAILVPLATLAGYRNNRGR